MSENQVLSEMAVGDNSPPSVVDRTHKMIRTPPESPNGHMQTRLSFSESGEESDALMEDIRKGLLSVRAVVFLAFWYFFSFTTLFLNKYILAYLGGDPTVLGMVQLLMCATCGYVQSKYPCGLHRRPQQKESRPPKFFQNILLVGSLRFSTVVLGLVALWYVPVSFAETVKSSAPVFTVVISGFLLQERTTWLVNLSLVPVMGGLALCSANELHFNGRGFMAALATNISECLQNVFSKMLLSGETFKITAAELQYLTGLSSIWLQVPASLLLVDFGKVWVRLNLKLLVAYVLGGLSFHCQSLTEYMLLGYISPVTHSVANTAKRALLIWLSVLTFGNPVTFLSALGTTTVILGVFLYNKAQQYSMAACPLPTVSPKDVHKV